MESTGNVLEDRRRELARELIEKIGEDAEFREMLIHDSDAALEQVGLSERVNQLTDDVMSETDDEVSGFASFSLGVAAPRPSLGSNRPGPTWIIAQSSCSCSCGCGSFSRGC